MLVWEAQVGSQAKVFHQEIHPALKLVTEVNQVAETPCLEIFQVLATENNH